MTNEAATATQRAGFLGVRSRDAVLGTAPRLALRGGTPGATGVDGGTFAMVPRAPLVAACNGAPPRQRQTSPTSAAAAERLRAHQAGGDRRPSALPARPLAAPLPAARRPAREARQLPHVLLPPARLRRGARRLGGAAPRRCSLPARPPRWRGSAASSRSWRASAAGRPPCPRRPARPGS